MLLDRVRFLIALHLIMTIIKLITFNMNIKSLITGKRSAIVIAEWNKSSCKATPQFALNSKGYK